MQSRIEYFADLLDDCVEAVAQTNLATEDTGPVIAALVMSDSYNGLRKALLQASTMVANSSSPEQG